MVCSWIYGSIDGFIDLVSYWFIGLFFVVLLCSLIFWYFVLGFSFFGRFFGYRSTFCNHRVHGGTFLVPWDAVGTHLGAPGPISGSLLGTMGHTWEQLGVHGDVPGLTFGGSGADLGCPGVPKGR